MLELGPVYGRIIAKRLWSRLHHELCEWLKVFVVPTALFSALSLWSPDFYPLEPLLYFQVQYFWIGVCGSIYYLLQRRTVWVALSIFCVIANLRIVYIGLATQSLPPVPNPISTFRALVFNVHTSNSRYQEALAFIREERPNIIAVIEVDENWLRSLSSLADILPHSITSSRNHDNFGIALYSAYPLQNSEIKLFSDVGVPSISAGIEINTQRIKIIATHPLPADSLAYSIERDIHLERLREHILSLKEPVLLLGDLNVVSWSPIFERFIEGTGLNNAREGFGIIPTWPAWPMLLYPFMIPIDHCLVSQELRVKNIYRKFVRGSDHAALVVDLAVTYFGIASSPKVSK